MDIKLKQNQSKIPCCCWGQIRSEMNRFVHTTFVAFDFVALLASFSYTGGESARTVGLLHICHFRRSACAIALATIDDWEQRDSRRGAPRRGVLPLRTPIALETGAIGAEKSSWATLLPRVSAPHPRSLRIAHLCRSLTRLLCVYLAKTGVAADIGSIPHPRPVHGQYLGAEGVKSGFQAKI